MKKTVNNPSESFYNQTEELSNKADSKSTSIMSTTTKPEYIMTQEKSSILNAMIEMQDDAGNRRVYILEASGKLYYRGIYYLTSGKANEKSPSMIVCCFNSIPKEMTPYLPTNVDVIDKKMMAAYMWANHEVLCKAYKYDCRTMEDECGILDAIALQLYYIRQLSPKYYKDNMGFSEPYKKLRNYTYVSKLADEIYQKL